jgi:hypothetical protein
MARFDKVKMAFSKVSKFWGLIVALAHLISFVCYFWWLETYSTETWENHSVKIRCNDPNINHPMASNQLIIMKNILITFGILFSLILHAFAFARDQERVISIPYLRWMAFLIAGLLAVLPCVPALPERFGGMTPNFLAVCKPDQLNQLCNPYSRDWVEVMCTTPVQFWLPAVHSMLPKTLTIYYYLMWTSFFRMLIKWDWKGMFRCGWILQAISIVFNVGIGIMVFYCNEAQPLGLILGCSFVLLAAVTLILADLVWTDDDLPSNKDQLPRYWNDVLHKNITPQVGKLPTTLLPPCGCQYPASVVGPGSKPQKDKSTETSPSRSIYPKLPTGETMNTSTG